MDAACFSVLQHAPADGATNMAIDEAILEGYLADATPRGPTLRLYAWSPPALSLGRGQPARQAHDPAFLASERIDLVRRPSGGAAVLHEHERTYCVVGRLRAEPFPGGVHDTYRRIAEALVVGLATLGLAVRSVERRESGRPSADGAALCFARLTDHEIAAGQSKLVGSAQLRRRGAFLQHGSILSRADPARARRAAAASAAGVPFAGIEDLLGRNVDPERIDAALIRGFESAFGVTLRPRALSAEELARAERLRRVKYASAAWTLEGRA